MTEEKEAILKVARQIRRKILKANDGSSDCMCCEASHMLKDALKTYGIHVKVIEGAFKVDNPVIVAYGHFWCEWKHLPLDITADQFNIYQKHDNIIPAIIFGTWMDRYQQWQEDSDVKIPCYI